MACMRVSKKAHPKWNISPNLKYLRSFSKCMLQDLWYPTWIFGLAPGST